MKFTTPLQKGTLLKRYKRFFADIRFQDHVVTAHVPNTGSLKGCLTDDAPCLISTSTDPNRKLPYTLQMIRNENSWVGVNTHLANDLVKEAWLSRTLPHWAQFLGGQREVKINASSRIDLVLWNPQPGLTAEAKITQDMFSKYKFHFVEVKNVTMAQESKSQGMIAQFPDAVTERGQKHLLDLMDLQSRGHSTEIFFLVQRQDCNLFSPADHIDPRYAQLLREAHASGVQISAYPCSLSEYEAIVLNKPLAIRL